ncbi:MAG TPA: lysophospholipid acyltransferase family protein [Burkholderiales bacterium]|nr:lysophospholipid acyltransferase family protein [Burkholderiales bacterium]
MSRSEAAPAHLRLYRLLRVLLQVFLGLLTVALLFPFYGSDRRWRAVKRWSAGVCRALGVCVCVIGRPPARRGRALLGVANHVSWLDIPSIHSVWQVRFVAKSEVRHWPAIGWLAARTGTLFVERDRRRHATRINESIHRAFAEGDAIAVFPEGTTTYGDELRRFHASLLQPAVDEHALVVPVALRYVDAHGNIDTAPGYVGQMSLAESLARILSRRKIRVELRFLPAIDAEGRTRRELAGLAQAAIAAALNLPWPDREPGRSSDPRVAQR